MQFKEGHTVGIDLGTTYSTLALLDDQGNPVPIGNEDDQTETASVVLLSDTGHVVVGPHRTRVAMEDPGNVIDRIKRQMGNVQYKRTFDEHEITPEFVSALILKKLRQDAEKRIGKIGNAVITVPYYFNDSRRKATQDAGRIAGLNVIDIINEPTAATLTYAWKRGELGSEARTDRPRQALVYDLGGGTFDVTVVRYTPTHFQVLATDGDVRLGGVDWTERIVDHLAEQFKEKHGEDPRESAPTLQMLRHDCDEAKVALSKEPQVSISCRHGGHTLSVTISRSQFEELSADLTQRTLDTAALVLEASKLDTKELDAVIVVGGSTLMPHIPKQLEQLTGQEVYKDLSPFAAVAQGAAIHAAILDVKHRGSESGMEGKLRKMLESVKQEEVNSHGLGIAVKNPKTGKLVNHIMIPHNSQLPTERTQSFVTNVHGQARVSVTVVEGDAPDPDACSLLGKCRITDLPSELPQGSPVEVTYAFDESGRIKVRAKNVTGGEEATIRIERRGGLSDEQIDAYTRLASEYHVE